MRNPWNSLGVLLWFAVPLMASPYQTPSATPSISEKSSFTPEPPPSGMVRIYFFREKRFKGGGSAPYINLRNMQFDRLKNGTYFKVDVPPGPAEISCDEDFFVYDILDIDLEAGQTIFIAPAARPDVFGVHWEPKIIRDRLAIKSMQEITEAPAVRRK